MISNENIAVSLVIGVLLSAVFALTYWASSTTCKNSLKYMNLSGGFDFRLGCYVQATPTRRILLGNYSYPMEKINE